LRLIALLAAVFALSRFTFGQGETRPVAPDRPAPARSAGEAARALLVDAVDAGLANLEVTLRSGARRAVFLVAPAADALAGWEDLDRFLRAVESSRWGMRTRAIVAVSVGDAWRFAMEIAVDRRGTSAFAALRHVLGSLAAASADGELDTIAVSAQEVGPLRDDPADAEVRLLLLCAGPELAVLGRMAEIGGRLADESGCVRVAMSSPIALGDGRWLFETVVGLRADVLEDHLRGRSPRPPTAPLR